MWHIACWEKEYQLTSVIVYFALLSDVTIEFCIENYVNECCRGLIWVVYRNFIGMLKKTKQAYTNKE